VTPQKTLRGGYVIIRLNSIRPGTLSSPSRTRLVRVLLAFLLLSAAGLKIYGLVVDPLFEGSAFASPRLNIVTIELEVLLGLWLLSGMSLGIAWVVAEVFFFGLACISAYMALTGQRSCGCFGRVAVTPWLAFTIDVAAITMLFLFRPAPAIGTNRAAWLRLLIQTTAGTIGLLVLFSGAFLLWFDSPAEGLARLRGESISIEPAVTQLGDGVSGEQRTALVEVRNYTDQPIRIVGGTASCRCFTTTDLPLTIPPKDSRPISIQVRFKGSVGRFHHGFVLFTDLETGRVLGARFAGRVVQSTSP